MYGHASICSDSGNPGGIAYDGDTAGKHGEGRDKRVQDAGGCKRNSKEVIEEGKKEILSGDFESKSRKFE